MKDEHNSNLISILKNHKYIDWELYIKHLGILQKICEIKGNTIDILINELNERNTKEISDNYI